MVCVTVCVIVDSVGRTDLTEVTCVTVDSVGRTDLTEVTTNAMSSTWLEEVPLTVLLEISLLSSTTIQTMNRTEVYYPPQCTRILVYYNSHELILTAFTNTYRITSTVHMHQSPLHVDAIVLHM